MTGYDLKSLNLPKLYGKTLSLFTNAVESPVLQPLLIGSLIENGGIPKLRKAILEEAPTMYPIYFPEVHATAGMPLIAMKQIEQIPAPNVPYKTIRDYASAYRSGKVTPLEVAERILDAIEASDKLEFPMRAFVAVYRENVLEQARASTERFRSGKPISFLDGVPVAIKDEVDMLPYPSTVGTSFLGKEPVKRDSAVVGKLRDAGALLIGKTNMHEIGINPNGSNVHHGRIANPYDLQRDTGGSSSGSGAAVAAGFCPVAIGADGGGSIRIPAALCGDVGLKPTFGRVSERGAAPLCWSVAHLGPIGATVEDVAFTYAAIAGPDLEEPVSQHQPPVTIDGWDANDLNGIRLGVYWPWFRHATAEVVKANEDMLDKLVKAGAQIVEIEIADMDLTRVAHAITILAEMAECMNSFPEHRKDFADSTRISLVLGRAMTSADYLQAQRMRTRAMKIYADVLSKVDAIVTPATGMVAPIVPPQALSNGWSDLGVDTEEMRYMIPGNLTGLPAIVFPVGYSEAGMPIAMQVMGRPWEEALLLRVAHVAETMVERKLPTNFYPIL